MNAISTRGLKKTYKKNHTEALKGIDLEIPAGELFCLVGPNGAGKSTLIRILATLLQKTVGHVRVLGHDLDSELSKIRPKIAVVPQGVIANPNLRVWEHVQYYLEARGLSRGEREEKTREVLRDLGLLERRDHLVSSLSGGLRRRVVLAMVLASPSELIILDEPTVALDPLVRKETWEVLLEIKKKRTILMTTHSMEEVEALASRVGIVHEGRLIAEGTPKTLRDMIPGEKKAILAQGDLSRDEIERLGPVETAAGKWTVYPKDRDAWASLFKMALDREIELNVLHATLEDAFVRLVGGMKWNPGPVK